MSQDFDVKNPSPWDWSDKTIGALMKELEKVKDIIKETPNDQELGKKIREWNRKLTGDV